MVRVVEQQGSRHSDTKSHAQEGSRSPARLWPTDAVHSIWPNAAEVRDFPLDHIDIIALADYTAYERLLAFFRRPTAYERSVTALSSLYFAMVNS